MGKRKERIQILSKLLSGYSKDFSERILDIEKFKIVDDSNNVIHTLPYYLTNGAIIMPHEKKNCDDLLKLMDTNNCIALCDEFTADGIVEHGILTGNLSDLKSLLSYPDSRVYIIGRNYYNLEDNPNILTITNADISISEVLGIKERHKSSDKRDISKLTVDKQEVYLKIRELLREYKQIVTLGDATQGKRLLECLNGILENLKLFPEYINEKSINTILEEINISKEGFDEYVRLLNLYNSINDELEKGNLESDSDTVKTELDRRIEQITGKDVSSDINERTQEDYTKKIAMKINCLSQMAEIIFPIMQDPAINSIIDTLSQFFDRSLTPKELTYDERNRIKDKIIRFEKRRNNDDMLERAYLNYDIDLISEGKIGETEYVSIRDGYKNSRKTEIHTMDGVYQIDVDDKKTNVRYQHTFSRNGKSYSLEVDMPLTSEDNEKVWLIKPNGNDTMYSEVYWKNAENDYSVYKKYKGHKRTFYYRSKNDILELKPIRIEDENDYNQQKSRNNKLSLEFVTPELDKMTLSAIIHSIKGVMPKEILEVYRTVNPKIATLIENYGVEVQDDKTKKRRSAPNGHEEPE